MKKLQIFLYTTLIVVLLSNPLIAQNTKAFKPKGQIIGDWIWKQTPATMDMRIIFVKRGGKLYHTTVFKDGSSMTDPMTMTGKTIRYPNAHGEYYKLLPSGDLGLFNKENKRFGVATKN